MMTCESISEMLSGYLDDELTQGDYQRVDVHVRNCSQCRETLDEMRNLRDAVANSQPNFKLSDSQWEKVMKDIPAKASLSIGWILLIASSTSWIGFLLWQFAIDSEIEWWLKLMIASFWGGMLFLFLSVLRQRLVARKTDRYRKVKY